VHKNTVRRRRAVLGLLVALSLVLLSASLGHSSGGPLGAVQSGFLELFTPIEDGVNVLLTPVRDAIHAVDDVIHAAHQRDQYRAQDRRLLAENAALEAGRRELLALRRQFTLDKQLGLTSYDQVVAQVSDEAPSVWYAHVTIDAGSGAGIRTGDVVIDGDGLVGRVSTVSGDAAEVTLLTDASFAVDARDAVSGVWGIAEPPSGSSSQLVLDFPSGASVAVGDSIVTAGTGPSQFPPNIPIGAVTSVDRATQTITITPYANVRQLEDVEVLTHPQEHPNVVTAPTRSDHRTRGGATGASGATGVTGATGATGTSPTQSSALGGAQGRGKG
jgi:rod shape-determining protein MreC